MFSFIEIEDVEAVAEEFKKRSAVPKYVFEILKAIPADSHSIVMFYTAILEEVAGIKN
jgi:citrate synthase